MKKRLVKRTKKPGMIPGTLEYVGERTASATVLSIIDYDGDNHHACRIERVEEAFPFRKTPTVTWLDVAGLQDAEVMRKLGEEFSIHSLVLEDILHTSQRPKAELSENYIFIVLKMLRILPGTRELDIEQVSLILGANYVITFQEKEGDVFDSLRERIAAAKGRIRKAGADYLAYALIDIIVDHYFLILEQVGEHVEQLEIDVLDDPDESIVSEIHRLKRELIFLRKSTWPLREEISLLLRDGHELICPDTLPFLRDVYDHTIQVIDTVETLRDMVTGLLDVYLSSVSNRMNEVMKVLTIIATIFIPLTFIAGIYGMNFDYMPELHNRWAYPIMLVICTLIAGAMVIGFKRKNWL